MKQIRYALRGLRRDAGFTLVAILTLALGIGVNSAIFSIIDAVMIRPLEYPSPERLISMWETVNGETPARFNTSNASADPAKRTTVSLANLIDYRHASRSFNGIASWEIIGMNLTGDGSPERLAGERVSADVFSVLRVAPAQGRAFLPEEEQPGKDHVVILSYGLWQRRLGLDPNWSSKSLSLDGAAYRIVGIMPRDFESPGQLSTSDRLSFFVPASYPAAVAADHSTHQVWVVGRLAPAATIQTARAEMDTISLRLAGEHPDTNRNLKTAMTPLSEDLVENSRTSLLVMAGAVGLVLLIACANLANLLLAPVPLFAAGRNRSAIRPGREPGARRAGIVDSKPGFVGARVGCRIGVRHLDA